MLVSGVVGCCSLSGLVVVNFCLGLGVRLGLVLVCLLI